MDSNESRWSVMNSASLGQFGTWVPYISHHVIDKEEDLYVAGVASNGKLSRRQIPTPKLFHSKEWLTVLLHLDH